jgi:hypothetical protein
LFDVTWGVIVCFEFRVMWLLLFWFNPAASVGYCRAGGRRRRRRPLVQLRMGIRMMGNVKT